MTITLEVELKRLRKAAGEAVRRGIEESDWLGECVPHWRTGPGNLPTVSTTPSRPTSA